jgi:hypothetical protein
LVYTRTIPRVSKSQGAIRSSPAPVSADTARKEYSTPISFSRASTSSCRPILVERALVGGTLASLAEEGDPLLGQQLENRHHVVHAGGVLHVDDQEACIRGLKRVSDPRHRVISADRWQIHQLKVDVLISEHPRQGKLGGEWVGSGFGTGPRQPCVKGRLAHVWSTDQHDLRRAFGTGDVARPAAATLLLGTRQLLREVLDPRLDLGLKMLAALVLRNRPEHLVEAVQALLRSARRPEGGFCLLVFR